MTQGELNALLKGIAPTLREKFDALEAKIAALESRKSIGCEYAGTFVDGGLYGRGMLVTRNGGLWLALEDTHLVPGTSAAAWKLVVKSGRA